MTYTLQRLALGSYDLILDGAIVGSVVRIVSACGHVDGWLAELMDDATPRSKPFTQASHEFRTLDAIAAWLGCAPVDDER